MSLDDSFAELENNLGRLESRYLSPHLNDVLAEGSELDVKSYCILSHALFEQFIENVCSTVANFSKSSWDTPERVVTRPLLNMVGFHGPRCSTEAGASETTRRGCDVLRRSVDEAVKSYLTYVRQENHGITAAHLRKMLWPVAIEIPDEMRYEVSLAQLTKNRGFHAHGYDIKKIISPQEALNWVKDCKDLCREIKDDANRLQGGAVSSVSRNKVWWRRVLGSWAALRERIARRLF